MRIANLVISLPVIFALSALACSDAPPVVPTDDGIDSGASGFTSSETGDDGANYDSGGPVKLDAPADEEGMAEAEAGDQVEEVGCKKVDLLFVIDNSGSMSDEQGNLANSVPDFISEIQTQLADAEGYHIGVITTDEYEYNEGCSEEGALVIATGGDDSSEEICGPYADGFNFMTENDDLDTAFTCAALVGTDGDGDERPMQTLQAALEPDMNGPGNCNDGFLRDDALLVIVIITDEEDDHEEDGCLQTAHPGSSGGPSDWFEKVIAAKGGVEENIVVLALVGPPGPEPAQCPVLDKCHSGVDGAEVAERVVAFTEMFTNGFVGRICEESFGGFFSQAVGVIESACDNFVPIG